MTDSEIDAAKQAPLRVVVQKKRGGMVGAAVCRRAENGLVCCAPGSHSARITARRARCLYRVLFLERNACCGFLEVPRRKKRENGGFLHTVGALVSERIKRIKRIKRSDRSDR